ncbi:23111_t:CDS:2, partial [Dentiscutata erythropus]
RVMDFYRVNTIGNWTCVNLLEDYRSNTRYKDKKQILDCIKKNFQGMEDSNSFDAGKSGSGPSHGPVKKGEARKILDNWKCKLGLLVASDELLIRRLVQAGTTRLIRTIFNPD